MSKVDLTLGLGFIYDVERVLSEGYKLFPIPQCFDDALAMLRQKEDIVVAVYFAGRHKAAAAIFNDFEYQSYQRGMLYLEIYGAPRYLL